MERKTTNDRDRRCETPDLKTLFRWLGSDNPKHISASSGLLVERVHAELPRFVRESLNKRRSDKFRIRMLAVIEHMANPLPPTLWLQLFHGLGETDSDEIKYQIVGVLSMHQSQTWKQQDRARELAAAGVSGASIDWAIT